MSKKIKILTPRVYEHSEFFHNAIDFAREHSLNTNELCLELSHYLVDNFEKIWKVEKPRIYKKLADLKTKLTESESRFQAHKETDAKTIQEQSDLIDQLKQQLTDAEKHIDSLELQLREQYQLVDEKDEQLIEKEEQLLKFLHRISEQNEEIEDMKSGQKELCLRCGGLTHKQYEQDKTKFAIEQLEKLASNSVILEGMFLEGEHYLHQKRYNVVGKGDIENLIKELKEGEQNRAKTNTKK